MTAAVWLLAIDQGTTGTTSVVVDVSRPGPPRLLGRGYARVPPTLPRAGWVEHSPDVIWQSVENSATQALDGCAREAGQSRAQVASRLAAVSLANQRETALVWQDDGQVLGNAIVWQDRRTAEACQALRAKGHEEALRRHTGLVADPYFSASKWLWLLDAHAGARARAERGALRLGTVDSFLLWRLTGGHIHRTDTTNAARTGVFDIHSRTWEPDLCALWGGVPMAALPEVCASDAQFGHVRGVGFLPDGLPIVGALGDQHAALVGQGGTAAGLAKCTLGTGGFALLHTGARAPEAGRALIQTIAYDFQGTCRYALEGSMFVAGALLEFLRDGLGLVSAVDELSVLANEVPDTDGVTFVPALTGFGAPHWRPQARGMLAGLSRSTTRAHVARAALEGVALQSAELLQAMVAHSPAQVPHVRMDGGAAANDLLLQMHADFLDLPVVRPASVEATAMGAALVGAVGLGQQTEADLLETFREERRFVPNLPQEQRRQALAQWQRWAPLA